MDEKLLGEGLTIAPGVIETIVSIAVGQVDGVAQVGSSSFSGSFKSAFSKNRPSLGILILADEDKNISVDVHVLLIYGYRLQEVGEKIREVVIDTLDGQVGLRPACVDVYVDGIYFPES